MIMPFGKHGGKRISEIPQDYLLWVLDNCRDISPTLRREIELTLDFQQTAPADSPGGSVELRLVPEWYRQLAMEFHPDKRGGSHDGMIAVTRARDLLVEMMEGSAV